MINEAWIGVDGCKVGTRTFRLLYVQLRCVSSVRDAFILILKYRKRNLNISRDAVRYICDGTVAEFIMNIIFHFEGSKAVL